MAHVHLISCAIISHKGKSMYIKKDTLDDLLRKILKLLLDKGKPVKSTKGSNKEYIGILLELENPLARLSRSESKGTLFSCLGELFWYMSKSDDASFIDYYIPDYGKKFSDDGGKTIYGAYGKRLFAMRKHDQVSNIIKLLKDKPSSRRAVIQLFDAEDIGSEQHRDIPCTCTLQFLVRDKKLHLIVNMRSNDAFLGLPHDIFCFTMIQEMIAKSLNTNMGSYRHFVGSLHLYDKDVEKAKKFISEGHQEKIEMPSMPNIDPFEELDKVLCYASKIRIEGKKNQNFNGVSDYWEDLLCLLLIFHFSKREFMDIDYCKEISSSVDFQNYSPIAKKRIMEAPRKINRSDL